MCDWHDAEFRNIYNEAIVYKKHNNKTQKKKKNLPMAQTMHLALFGPIFITHLPWAIKNMKCI